VKIEFFEPPMCCPTGICGPSVDERLVKLNENIGILKKKYNNIQVERYMITQQPMKFRENEDIYKLIKEKGRKILPITTINGKIFKTEDYPTLEEMEKSIGDE
jgi:hypothetical protein